MAWLACTPVQLPFQKKNFNFGYSEIPIFDDSFILLVSASKMVAKRVFLLSNKYWKLPLVDKSLLKK